MKADVRPYREEDQPEVRRLMGSADGSRANPGAIGVVAEQYGSIVGLAFSIATGEVEGQLLDSLKAALAEQLTTPAALQALGGRVIAPGLWDELRGMDEAKEIIERRVILPLAEPGLAARHAVAPPKAIVLFGPPGTGKTTFAKGIASRLGWPFVEIEPSEIGAEGADRQAKLLGDAFDLLLELPEAVVFVDEVEDIASIRHDERRVSPSITNEFLKQIPRMREAPHHLLVCATNSVGMLDPAFLRPGRFDYVLPVGPPNDEARAAIWSRYVDEITNEPVDVGVLVGASSLFTPADIEWAARKAAQRAFEREHFEGAGSRAVTDDFLAAIGETRPTLTPAMVEQFESDTERFSRQ
jgi:transitional endoplasmic reticulum ATPase